MSSVKRKQHLRSDRTGRRSRARYTVVVNRGRAHRSVGFLSHTEKGIAPIVITAAISVIAFLAVLGWQIERSLTQKQAATSFVATYRPIAEGSVSPAIPAPAASTASSTDVISYIGPAVLDQLVATYQGMVSSGSFSIADAQKAAEQLAPYLRAPVEYTTYRSSDIATDPDTSYARMLRYRSDLRDALAPLLKNTQPEYEIFAQYVQTNDTTYLDSLRTIAGNYRETQTNMARVSVPADAVLYHTAIMDSLGEFASTLDSMAEHADDPFAIVALLRTYNQAEEDVLISFDGLTKYYKTKTL